MIAWALNSRLRRPERARRAVGPRRPSRQPECDAALVVIVSIESIPDRGITVTLRVHGLLAYKNSSVVRTFTKMKDRFRGPAIDRGEQ
jgi:hypothetical protein